MAEILPAITPTAQASTNRHTRDEAVTWVQNKMGTAEDYPGSGFGAQCVDLICFYYEYLGQSRIIGNANDYMSNTLPSGWTRYMNGQTTPQPGDIVVYDAYKYGALDVGHIGIVIENSPQDYKYIDYNGCGGNGVGYACPGNLIHGAWSSPCCGGIGALRVKQLHEFSCVIRPDWPDPTAPTPTPTPPSDPSYEFDAATGTLTISGTKAIDGDLVYSICMEVGSDNIRSIVVTSGIPSIEDDAFSTLSNLTSVTLPDSISRIGCGAFRFCENLASINIPNGVVSIEDYTFHNCPNLTNVVISTNITGIGKYAFCNCKNLKSISLPNSITSIGEFAFSGCTNIGKINLPHSLFSIGEFAFNDCGSLTSISIPNSVTSIGKLAFDNCINLENVVINGNPTITGDIFWGCENLKNVTLPATIIKPGIFSENPQHVKITGPGAIPDMPWQSGMGYFSSVELENGITHIGNNAFWGCTFSNIVIPSSVTSIGEYAFGSCDNLETIIIPEGVSVIEDHAFYSCDNLTSVTLPSSIISVGSGAFWSCDNITSLTLPKNITSDILHIFVTSNGLTDIYYGGSESEWLDIDKDFLSSRVTVHYNSTGPNTGTTRRLYNRIRVYCPVDVEVCNANGLVGSVVSNTVTTVDKSKVRISVNNREKDFYLLNDDTYIFRMIATGDGVMTYAVQNIDVDTEEVVKEQIFTNVSLTEGKQFTSKVEVENTIAADVEMNQVKLYVLGQNGVPEKKVLSDGKGTEVPLSVYLITFNATGGSVSTASMQTGADGKLTSWPTPTRTGYTFNGWFASASGGTPLATDTVFTEDTTVYAQWTAASVNPTPTPGPNNPVGPTNPGDFWNGYTPTTSYTITTPTTPYGTVTVSPKSASKGSTVTITATPDTGYQLTTLTVTDNNGKEVSLTDRGNGAYAFTMPGGKVSISAVFQLIKTSWSNPFTDVSTGAWYYDAVKFVSENGLMNGVGNSLFEPESNLSRGMLTQILYNKEGQPAVTDNSAFTDVKPETWYFNAVSWASVKGIVDGYGNGLFGPNNNITREQLAVMLWRYAGKPVPPNLLLNFTDANLVSDYAMDAMRWAVDKGIINGKGNDILDPGGYATRAEAAQMLKNYLSK